MTLRSPCSRAVLVLLVGSISIVAANAEKAAMTVQDLDRLVRAVWEAKGIEPVGRSGDAEFLRRVSFDLIGTPPDYRAADRFLRSDDSERRDKVVDSLLADEAYGIHRANLLMEEIVQGRIENRRLPPESFEEFFQTSFNRDKPYDRMVSELIAFEGDSAENGAAFLAATHQGNPEDLTGTVMRLFNGTQLRCVQCHDDKFGGWKQTDFWGTAAFFARIGVRPNEKMGNRIVSVVVQERKKGEMIIPEGGVTPNFRSLPKEERESIRRKTIDEMRSNPIEPSFLGSPVEITGNRSRRVELAQLVTSPVNPLFARSTVNRVWAEMFGKGLIEPVDDIHGKDAGEWEPVLEALAGEFVRSGHRLKSMYAVIARSEAYQLSSQADSDVRPGLEAHFARSRMRAHRPEVLLDAIFHATRVQEGADSDRNSEQRRTLRRKVLSRFAFAFGNDEGNRALNFEATIPQALMMMNDPIVEKALAPTPGSTLLAIGQETRDARERVRLMYLAALTREPTEGELADALEHIRSAAPESSTFLLAEARATERTRQGKRRDRNLRREAEPYQDLLWALMNTSEFLYNH